MVRWVSAAYMVSRLLMPGFSSRSKRISVPVLLLVGESSPEEIQAGMQGSC